MAQCAKCRIVDDCDRGWKDLKEPYMNCVSFSPIITNADRIRAMTDEELAEFISGKAWTFGEEYDGYMSALDWLREEAKA